jgi:3-oxoadipate enol-lactonase
MTAPTNGPPGWPTLPPGRFTEVDDQTLFLRDSGSDASRAIPSRPSGRAVPIVLLHGLTSTADLTWFSVFEPLAARTRVLAPDLPGHGSSSFDNRFDLELVADTIGRLIERELDEPVLLVGFSMGGVEAQLIWRRHRANVAGLVLCSTAATFRPTAPLRRLVTEPGKRALIAAGVRAPLRVRRWLAERVQTVTVGRTASRDAPSDLQRWAREELFRSDPLGVVAAGAALARYDGTAWVGSIDVPCALVLTAHDSVVPISRQRDLARAVHAADVFELEGDHGMFVEDCKPWAAAVVRACDIISAKLS